VDRFMAESYDDAFEYAVEANGKGKHVCRLLIAQGDDSHICSRTQYRGDAWISLVDDIRG
jgi:hypothetical protein